MADTWWIDEPRLLGSSNPSDDDLAALAASGFNLLVCLLDDTEETPRYSADRIRDLGYRRRCIPVRNFHAPALEQLDEFVALAETLDPDGRAIVHCQAGVGRTGTMAAAYWIARGLDLADAIARVRRVRPGAVESDEQKAVLEAFAARRRQASGASDRDPFLHEETP